MTEELLLGIVVGAIYAAVSIRVGTVIARQQTRQTGKPDGVWVLGAMWPLAILIAGVIVVVFDCAVGFQRSRAR